MADTVWSPPLFRDTIVRPALQAIGQWSEAAEQLVLGTALVESGLRYVRQLGGGPALGYFQMEPDTHGDIWQNFLIYREKLADAVYALIEKPDNTGVPSSELLVDNHKYAAAMCRVHYLRAPAPLPAPNDLAGMAAYWKRFYNTPLGKGTPLKFMEAWANAKMEASK